MALLHIRSMPISHALPSPAMFLLNRPSRGILLRFISPPTRCGNNESNHSTLISRQPQTNLDTVN